MSYLHVIDNLLEKSTKGWTLFIKAFNCLHICFFTRVKTDFIFFTLIKITYISHNLHGQIFRHFWHQFVQKRHKFINKSLSKNDVFRQKNCWKNKNPTVRYTLETYRSQTKLTDLTEKETFRVATTLHSFCFIRNAYKERFWGLVKSFKKIRNRLVIFQKIKEQNI